MFIHKITSFKDVGGGTETKVLENIIITLYIYIYIFFLHSNKERHLTNPLSVPENA